MMTDADSRKERAQGQTFERDEDALLYQRYIKMKQDRDSDKSKEQANRISLEDAIDIVGTCEMMCPEFESLQRYFERDLDPFEKSPTGAYDRSLMVQTFARAAAGNDLPPPEDIRPPRVLRATIEYLLDNILVQHGIEATHNFIWNRTRAVRSDLTRQRAHSPDAAYCLERIVRYHILALHVVCRGQREVETLEIEQLKKALQSLMEVYQDARSQYSSPHEPEFRSYYILMHIRSKHAPFTLRHLPSSVYNSPTLQWALRIRFTIARNTDGADEHNSDITQMDYAGFFDLLSGPHTSYLTACLLESHFDDIRRQLCLMLGLTLKNTARLIPLQYFQNYLRLDSVEDAVGWVTHLKWNITPQGVVEIPQSRKLDVLLPPLATATAYPRPKSRLVQIKRLMAGQPPMLNDGVLDSHITRSEGSTFGRDFAQPPLVPQRRRTKGPVFLPAPQPIVMAPRPQPQFQFQPQSQSQPRPEPAPPPQLQPQPHFQAQLRPQINFPSSPANPISRPTQQLPSQTQPLFQLPSQSQPLFNPFGRQSQRPTPASVLVPVPPASSAVAITVPTVTDIQPIRPNLVQQRMEPAYQPSPPVFTPFSAQSSLTSSVPLVPQVPPRTIPPVSAAVTVSSDSRVATSEQVKVQPTQPASLPAAPLKTTALGFSDMPHSTANLHQSQDNRIYGQPTRLATPSIGPERIAQPTPSALNHTSYSLTDLSSDTTSVVSVIPARREGPRKQFSDGYISAASSVMPASTQADGKERVHRTLRLPESDDETTSESSDNEAVLPLRHQLLHSQAQEHNRLSTLKGVVQQWRDVSARSRAKLQERSLQLEKAEKSAQEISLGVRFLTNDFDFTRSTPQKRLNKDQDETRIFMMAEKDAQDRENVWEERSFQRIAIQAAKRRTAGGELPAGWEMWVSFLPGSSTHAEWLKVKFAGNPRTTPNLSKFCAGPPTGDGVRAPGLLILQLDAGSWDSNLRRVEDLLECLPDDSPYTPGLLMVMLAPKDQLAFPVTWVSKLDRVLRNAVMDRRALVVTNMESGQALEADFFHELNALEFDVEGRAPRLSLRELVSEYMNWWTTELEYGSDQALNPTVDLDILLSVISVMMSGLDEFLRQICLQCRVNDIGIPFNNFQSKRDLEGACIEMVDYLKKIGGNFRRFPTTPAALLQDPGILFQILSRTANGLKSLIIQKEEALLPRPGLKRPQLQKLGEEYNEKLEKDLKTIDRTTMIYSQPPGNTNDPAAPNLKRKRQSSVHTNGLPSSGLSEEPKSPSSVVLKRSRASIEQPQRTGSPLRISFKVQMAKARLDLKVVQAVDIEKLPNEKALSAARANALATIAQPLIDAVLKTDIPSDKDVIECRAMLELLNGVQDSVFGLLSQNKLLTSSIISLANLSDKPGGLEFRELVSVAYGLAERFESESISSYYYW
ncbi:hypothetical protein FRC15_003246 [Serendipita sp. 397]|nr:hypothetical protein FRC15_003246 [Serendipita sp. 397]